jgi:hypothetical protein
LELLDAVRDVGIAFFGTFLLAAPFAALDTINASNFSRDTACATNSSPKQDMAHPTVRCRDTMLTKIKIVSPQDFDFLAYSSVIRFSQAFLRSRLK